MTLFVICRTSSFDSMKSLTSLVGLTRDPVRDVIMTPSSHGMIEELLSPRSDLWGRLGPRDTLLLDKIALLGRTPQRAYQALEQLAAKKVDVYAFDWPDPRANLRHQTATFEAFCTLEVAAEAARDQAVAEMQAMQARYASALEVAKRQISELCEKRMQLAEHFLRGLDGVGLEFDSAGEARGARVRAAREAREWSQADLANAVGAAAGKAAPSAATISRMEASGRGEWIEVAERVLFDPEDAAEPAPIEEAA